MRTALTLAGIVLFCAVTVAHAAEKPIIGAKEAHAEDTAVPKVLKTVPEAYAGNVDPKLAALSVTFDRPMQDKSWSWTGGGDSFPKSDGESTYDAAKSTCTMPVKLEPGKVYWVGINSTSHNNFKTPDGVPAAWYVILFATASADGKPTPIPPEMLRRAKVINADK